MAIDNRLQVFNEEGQSVDYDILASDVKFLPDGKDLPTKLAEMEQEIGQGGYTPPAGGIPKTDLAPSVQTSLGLADTALQASDKSELQTAITSLQNALNTLIGSGNVQGAIDTFNEVTAFLNGIDTSDPTLKNQLLALSNAITALQTTLNSKANAADVYLKSQTYTKGEVDDIVDGIEAGETVVINSDGANIVDEHDNNSVLLAPSARQMKLMYNNIMAIYNGLANIAFTNGKPTLDWIGSKTKYALSYGTMTGCTADVAAGQVNEGALRIKLTPTQASYAFTLVTVNGESVATTATGDADGSVYLDIVVNGNITVAATAVSGYEVTYNGSTHCSSQTTSVASGQDLELTLNADSHFTLPQTISVTINGVATNDYSYARAAGNRSATLTILSQYINGTVNIDCDAIEDSKVTLDLSGVDSHIVVTNTTDGGTLVHNANIEVYTEQTKNISFEPSSGWSYESGHTPTIASGTGGTMSSSGNTYTLTIAAGSTGTIVVTASTEHAPLQVSYPLQSAGVVVHDVTNNVDLDGTTGTMSVNYEGSLNLLIKPVSGYSLSAVTYAIGSGSSSNATSNGDGTFSIIINSLTDNLVISATAAYSNIAYKNVRYTGIQSGGATVAVLAFGPEEHSISPLIDLGENRNASVSVKFGIDGISSTVGIKDNHHLIEFNENLEPVEYWGVSAVSGVTKSIPTTTRYVRFSGTNTHFPNMYIEVGGARVFAGSDYSESASDPTKMIGTWQDFVAAYVPDFTNSNGGHPHFGLCKKGAANLSPSFGSAANDKCSFWRAVGTPAAIAASGARTDMCVSEEINLTGVSSVLFKCGTGTSSDGFGLHVVKANGTDNFVAQGAERSATVSGYTTAYITSRLSEYEDTYIKNASTDQYIWKGEDNFSEDDLPQSNNE